VEKERARAVLEWLRDLVAWVSEDPVSRVQTALEEMKKHKVDIVAALEVACEDELREYVDFVYTLISGSPPPREPSKEDRAVEEPVEGGEDRGDQGGSGVLQEKGEGESDAGVDAVHELAEDGGRVRDVPVDVEGGVQGRDDGHSVLLHSDSREDDGGAVEEEKD